MDGNIVVATSEYEAWLRGVTDVQRKALDQKHDEMATDTLPLLRATFYRWVRHWIKLCPELHSRDEDVVLAVGDLHLENFGIWLDSRSRLVWGVNDFDEACELPFTNDLVRLAASVNLATEGDNISAGFSELCQSLLDGFREAMDKGGEPILVDEERCPELNKLVGAVRSAKKFWKKTLDEDRNPKINKSDLPPQVEDVFRASFPRSAQLEYRRERKPGGLGSLGRRRFIAIASEGNKRETREAKALVPSALYWSEKRPGMPSQTGTLLQRAIRSPDPHLQVHDRWLVRRIAPDALKIELPESLDHQRLVISPALMHLMGFETANIHLGSRGPSELLRSLDQLDRKVGRHWLEEASARMVSATANDHRVWAAHHKPSRES